jgi:hypothetical protein
MEEKMIGLESGNSEGLEREGKLSLGKDFIFTCKVSSIIHKKGITNSFVILFEDRIMKMEY